MMGWPLNKNMIEILYQSHQAVSSSSSPALWADGSAGFSRKDAESRDLLCVMSF